MEGFIKEAKEAFIKEAKEAFVGLSIKGVRYLSEEEANNMYIQKRPIVLILSDGTQIMPFKDAEGNDGGALWSCKKGRDLNLPAI